MKNKYLLAMKFYRESKNEEQLSLAYKEFDILLDIFYDFKWYIKFDINKISQKENEESVKK